jgi:hypothetical protein
VFIWPSTVFFLKLACWIARESGKMCKLSNCSGMPNWGTILKKRDYADHC